MTALSFGGAPGVAVLGGDLSQLRRRGGRWRLRDWRLRTKLTAVLLVPLILAGVLGTLRVSEVLREAERLSVLARQMTIATHVAATVHDLQRERHLAVTALLAPGSADSDALPAQAERVDRKITALRSADFTADAFLPAAATAYQAALDRLPDLFTLREEVFAPAGAAGNSEPPANRAISRYTEVSAVLLTLHRSLLAGADDPLEGHAEGIAALAVAKEQISQQHAVLLAATLGGALPAAQQSSLRTADARFDAAMAAFGETGLSEHRLRYMGTVSGPAITERERLLDTALREAPENALLKITPDAWDAVATETAERIRQVEISLLNQLQTEAAAVGGQAQRDAIRDSVVIAALMALAVLLVGLVMVRSLLRPLRTLRTHAFDVADRRLPDVVEELQTTNEKIGEMAVEPVPVYSREEIGQVARAFDTVHVQAVRLAAEQAMLRGTLNDIFLNLAGRSQYLVERQLKLIEKLETGEQDPQQLSNFFQLDHLITRMRRNNENLLVLAGGDLRRGAERDVAVFDMLRSAISKVAEYRRVTLRRPPAAAVTGPVVGDLVHLIAELLDNATNASPPDTAVLVSSALSEDGGLRVEITDSGTGLPSGELHAINERLSSPPVLDVSVSRQMGLFVVSRLAARHRIRVWLRQQRGEAGITAAVLLPADLVRADPPVTTGPPVDPNPPAATGPPPAGDWEGAADPAQDTPPSGTGWSAQHMDVPLQVSVVENADEELLGPSSIGNLMHPRRNPQRTTEQEWHELFGLAKTAHPDVGPSADPGSRPDPGQGADIAPVAQLPVPGAGAPAAAEPAVHEEIFEEVSAWFLERQSATSRRSQPDDDEIRTPPTGFNPLAPSPARATPPEEWRSAGDEGWRAATALRNPADFDVTSAGLPKRRPRAQLVPGTAGPSQVDPTDSAHRMTRIPDRVRGRLSSYQQGLRHGRHARVDPDDPSDDRYRRPGPN